MSIYLYYRDHSPPHFHALYGGDEAEIRIDNGEVLVGRLPPRAMAMVREWAGLHATELMAAWNQAHEALPLDRITPLP
ncbi:MAG: DUF4160 domain-containing protein [Planctomycetes bacterium]|nr:DUF4160 domain-containing protein [Planctomycetota bacterium]